MSKISVLFFAAIACWSSAVRAESADFASIQGPEAEDVSKRHAAVELNPMALNLAHLSINIEVALAGHHALVLAPILQLGGSDVGSGFLGELGYRFYSSDEGLQGFFMGPSLGAGTFTYYTDQVSGAQRASSISVAFDFGYQFALRSGVMLGFGAGVQYQRVHHDYDVRNDPVNGLVLDSGVLPRILFSVGYGQ
ncbi:MAG TPA: DUF3575 domain-containing protein [Polyangiaceae bacterium]|jgi:hypothetical protein